MTVPREKLVHYERYAFRKMQRLIYDAGRGLSTAVGALADLGLEFETVLIIMPEVFLAPVK